KVIDHSNRVLMYTIVQKCNYFKLDAVTYIPMDDTLTRTVEDISGRPYLSFNAKFSKEKVGTFDTELVEEFLRALVINSRLTTHIDFLRCCNTHHEIESIVKSF